MKRETTRCIVNQRSARKCNLCPEKAKRTAPLPVLLTETTVPSLFPGIASGDVAGAHARVCVCVENQIHHGQQPLKRLMCLKLHCYRGGGPTSVLAR